MKIIQTFWPCYTPNHKEQDIFNITGGWSESQYHWMSWAFSCLQLKKYYDNVELITNDLGKEILVNKFKLPYTEVSTVLESDLFNHLPPQLWAVSKIFSYGIQKDPFIHVDGDVYIFDTFSEQVVNKPLIAQNLEINLSSYYPILKIIRDNFEFLPPCLLREQEDYPETVVACNAGILGGQDVAFFEQFSSQAFDFLEKNKNYLHKAIHNRYFNTIIEQYLFACLCRESGKHVSCLFNPISEGDDFRVFVDIFNTPATSKYIHLLGPFKKGKSYIEFLTRKLRFYYPDYYYNILKQLKHNDKRMISPFYRNKSIYQLRCGIDDTAIKDERLTGKSNSIFLKEQNNFNDIFKRTIRVMESLCKEQDSGFISQEGSYEACMQSINYRIAELRNEETKRICNDVFNFECRRIEFIGNLSGDLELYNLDLKSEKDVVAWNLPPSIFQEKAIVLDGNVTIIDVNWDWRYQSLDAGITKVITQIPRIQKILLCPDVRNLGISEYLLSDLHFHIYSNFKRRRKLADFFSKCESESDLVRLEKRRLVIENIIKRALYNGILRLD